ncbi:MAG: D-tyrosyl-tRNA(Tyr) deacylase [Propionibacteriaceae bacterium]|jgi:D-tyrosyl-tRNA(Tyr) deacylase|nr:D-tyrosyl-tRNA(Tyr) deacylase [Propionibacteriaceae bacterium]
MRAVLQRVDRASVSVDGEIVGEITQRGLCVLLAVTHSDNEAVADRMADKVWGLRIFDNPVEGQPELSALDLSAPLLVISQFTLYADTRKGRRPSWNRASGAAHSEPLVAAFVQSLRKRGAEVACGRFGAQMKVSLVNDGPVTVIVEVTEN